MAIFIFNSTATWSMSVSWTYFSMYSYTAEIEVPLDYQGLQAQL